MEYLAHSAKEGFPAQTYAEHIRKVNQEAVKNAREAAKFAEKNGELIIQFVDAGSMFHDLGKLDPQNQKVLQEESSHKSLPINHVDAGAAALKKNGMLLPALNIYSHHQGLPNFPSETTRRQNCFRDKDFECRQRTDRELPALLKKHQELMGEYAFGSGESRIQGDVPVFTRMQLSCLSDADHTDTARHYGKYPKDRTAPSLRAQERLNALDAYIGTLSRPSVRNQLRAEMYQGCRKSSPGSGIVACDSPVGSGKTTAVMAHLLSQAVERKARRIFVVLPFTNIITQSVDQYRKILVLPGEDPSDVVAALHHKADFENEEARSFNAQWRAPIIVTTAVAFFETIASNRPSALRRLHELPGSMIFLDEAHAALPVRLLPLAWRWMQVLADEWGCYWVLASGSLVEFWKLEGVSESEREVPYILGGSLRQRLLAFEERRLTFPWVEKPISREELIRMTLAAPGPRLLIMNTVQSAAVMARDLLKAYGQSLDAPAKERRVLHISTALCAEDRETVLVLIKEKLDRTSPQYDPDWTLVATSCVEAGMDFSFHTGFREISSLLSLLQAAGRVNRSGEYQDAAIWSFIMKDDAMLSRNPMMEDSEKVLKEYFQEGRVISPALSTQSIKDELRSENTSIAFQELLRLEKSRCFADVEKKFKVIDSDTVLVIADPQVKTRIRMGMCDWKEIQRKGVSVYRTFAARYRLSPISENIYDWNLSYDPFFGIMTGVLEYVAAKNDFLCC